MPKEIRLAAVGDILMIGKILTTAYQAGDRSYAFDPIFRDVAPLLEADLLIGNLETPLAGREVRYERKNARTGFSTFNCPDELAATLKRLGFHVLTTANNHCMDRGEQGLLRTLKVLDEHDLLHTGTFASDPGAENHLIHEVNGVRCGIVSYSKSTNKIPVPVDKKWMVNVIDRANEQKIVDHIRRLAKEVDVVIACPHIGKECRHYPLSRHRRLVDRMLDNGAHVILGHHPHVIQPAFVTRDQRFAIFSLGNFISTRLYRNPATNCGAIARLTIEVGSGGSVKVKDASCIPTWSTRLRTANGVHYRILPLLETLQKPHTRQSASDRALMSTIWKKMKPLLAVKG